MQRTKYREIRRSNVIIEKEAEFEEIITHKFYTQKDIYTEFSNYKFTEFLDEFREEFNCQVRCHLKYYLDILNERRCLYFGRFLVSSLSIPNRSEVEFLALPCFDDRGNPAAEVNHILQNEVYTKVKVCVAMELKFLLFCSLDALTEYEQEQIEDHYDEGDDDEGDDDKGYQENQLSSQPVETPFISDNCSICLTAKPDIIIIPCLHQSVCSQCEEAGKLTKCPTCRETIIKKVKI